MTDRKFLRPTDGLALPLPDGRPWPTDGEWVDVDQYVRRRLADGDLVPAKPPTDEPSAEPKKGK